MIYKISYQHPAKQYIDIELSTKTNGKDQLIFQLPAWRPGRYELGNFAKNIQKWNAFDENGNALKSKKLTKDRWEVKCNGAAEVLVKYNYYANVLNAGSTYLDEDQLYVNPVNCLLYNEDHMASSCELNLELPENYTCAIALEKTAKFNYLAKNFDELADSPFIASDSLQSVQFEEGGTTFYLWFQGEIKLDERLLLNDFAGFTNEQIKLFGDFPTSEYHYLFQILPYSAYHGVEHSASTVISLGPSYDVLKKDGRYEDLLGVSSHELFHTWNVKRIRPVEMWPYDFSKENYTRLGYLTEGATTWYGDLMLYRSGVFNDKQFFKTFNQILDRHFNNPGSSNLSVADSSFDTWLDGYVSGVPNRKASIYTEGALITFMLDMAIRKATDNKKSFDDVMCMFYENFYKKGKGISESDYRNTVEEVAGSKLNHFFDNYINGNKEYTADLESALDYVGLKKERKPSAQYHEAYLGVKLVENQVVSIFPDSPSEKAGITVSDKLTHVNGIMLQGNLSEWLQYFKNETIELGLYTAHEKYKTVKLKISDQFYYAEYQVSILDSPNDKQKVANEIWRKTGV